MVSMISRVVLRSPCTTSSPFCRPDTGDCDTTARAAAGTGSAASATTGVTGSAAAGTSGDDVRTTSLPSISPSTLYSMLQIRSGTRIDPGFKPDAGDVFQQLDADGDGKVNREELLAGESRVVREMRNGTGAKADTGDDSVTAAPAGAGTGARRGPSPEADGGVPPVDGGDRADADAAGVDTALIKHLLGVVNGLATGGFPRAAQDLTTGTARFSIAI